MEKGLVSVVIPVYNVEKYLDRCVESIVNQTYRNLEIILVDDGSPDRCPQMCDAWAARDGRVKVIHQKNSGAGLARNTGMENASGEYICFLDSDDFFRLDTIAIAYAKATETQADIIVYGLQRVNPDGQYAEQFIPNTPKDFFEGDEILSRYLPNLIGPTSSEEPAYNIWMGTCMGMFRMEMIRRCGWHFVSERQIIAEDVYAMLDLHSYVHKIAIIRDALYYYQKNNSSLTRTYHEDRYDKIKVFYDACLTLCLQKEYPKIVQQQLSNPYISFTIAALKQILYGKLPQTEKYRACRKILTDTHLHQVVSTIDFTRETKSRTLFLKAIILKQYLLVYFFLLFKTWMER